MRREAGGQQKGGRAGIGSSKTGNWPAAASQEHKMKTSVLHAELSKQRKDRRSRARVLPTMERFGYRAAGRSGAEQKRRGTEQSGMGVIWGLISNEGDCAKGPEEGEGGPPLGDAQGHRGARAPVHAAAGQLRVNAVLAQIPHALYV